MSARWLKQRVMRCAKVPLADFPLREQGATESQGVSMVGRRQQLLRLGMIWTFLYFIANQCSILPTSHVALFCIVPLVLSSWQLFLVGTYLPHRNTDSHKGEQPRSLYLPAFLSFASCYHFGYHREHHENPSVPWFKLPPLRTDDRRRRSNNLNLLQA